MKSRLRLIRKLINGTATPEEKVIGQDIPVVIKAVSQANKITKPITIKTRRKS